jgi:hypothetical protein
LKALREMTAEELNEALETLDMVRPEDTALRLAVYLQLRAGAAAPAPAPAPARERVMTSTDDEGLFEVC